MMRLTNALGSIVATAAALVALTFATDARADDFKVEGGAGSVTVTSTNPKFHLNKDFPWKAAGKPVKPSFGGGAEPTTATISGLAKGTIEVKGAICGEGNCVPFTKSVEVK
jgi:hypothetical protein